MKSVRFNRIRKVILFGGSPLLVAVAQEFRSMGLEIAIFTAPRQAEEKLDDSGQTLAGALAAAGFSHVATEDINTEPTLRSVVDSSTLGLGLGEAWSFNAKLIALFEGRLLDFMGIPLPRYRGGAHYTWLILRGERHWGSTLQIINEEMRQGEFDSGEIVASTAWSFPESARIPMDFFRVAVPREVAFLKEFLKEIEAGKTFELRTVGERESLFFPRLHTLTHGWIDWSWSGVEIERFICAFDEPYAGASTLLNGARVQLKGASLDSGVGPFHPFQSGLITRLDEARRLVVATREGLLAVTLERTTDDGDQPAVRVGDRFFTPRSQLDVVLESRVHYGPVSE